MPSSTETEGTAPVKILTAESREEIRDFVWRALSIPAAVAVALSALAGYAFRTISDSNSAKAYHDAFAEANKRLIVMTENVSAARREFELAVEGARVLVSNSKSLNEELKKSTSLAAIQKNSTDIAKLLGSDEEFKRTVSIQANQDLTTISDTVKKMQTVWGSQSQEKSYGNGRYIGTETQAFCDQGYYMVGIKVLYGGTCRGQCDADGGVVRNITVVCRRLP